MRAEAAWSNTSMMNTNLKFGIPDLELTCASGATINPAGFAGHALIAVFLPDDPETAAREMSLLRKTCTDFADSDGWILAFGNHNERVDGDTTARILTISDPGRRAWTAFRDLTDGLETIDRGRGATFLFTRGGNLQRYWEGPGHADEILQALRKPASGNPKERRP